jgi:hypothetical protein
MEVVRARIRSKTGRAAGLLMLRLVEVNRSANSRSMTRNYRYTFFLLSLGHVSGGEHQRGGYASKQQQ